MSVPLKGEAQLGDYTLAYNFAAFCALEAKTGHKMPVLMQMVQDGLGFTELRDFVWAGLLKNHKMGDAEVVAFLDEIGFEPAAAAIGKGITSFFGEQREQKGKNPPTAE
jgi:hypothetical protein